MLVKLVSYYLFGKLLQEQDLAVSCCGFPGSDCLPDGHPYSLLHLTDRWLTDGWDLILVIWILFCPWILVPWYCCLWFLLSYFIGFGPTTGWTVSFCQLYVVAGWLNQDCVPYVEKPQVSSSSTVICWLFFCSLCSLCALSAFPPSSCSRLSLMGNNVLALLLISVWAGLSYPGERGIVIIQQSQIRILTSPFFPFHESFVYPDRWFCLPIALWVSWGSHLVLKFSFCAKSFEILCCILWSIIWIQGIGIAIPGKVCLQLPDSCSWVSSR